MAHITIRPAGPGVTQLVINGIDVSNEVYSDIELVSVGEDPAFAEVGLRVTFCVSQLDLGEEQDVIVTDHLREAAQRVNSIASASDADERAAG